VADDGGAAVAQDGVLHTMWALPSLISSADAVLRSKKSVIRIVPGSGSLSGDAPDGSGLRNLRRVKPRNDAAGTEGDSMTIWADCGRAARDVIGAGGGTGENWDRMTGVYATERSLTWGERVLRFFGAGPSRADLREERETGASSPEAIKNEVFAKLAGGRAAYDAMPPAARDAFDRQAGINRYASPGVGEGYTISSGGLEHPGATTWNFHWGGVIMSSGEDRVALENYATGVPKEVNSDWEFQMYGSAARAGQTFHEQHEATKQHGQEPTTVRVRQR
jgi:hypothetical protein